MNITEQPSTLVRYASRTNVRFGAAVAFLCSALFLSGCRANSSNEPMGSVILNLETNGTSYVDGTGAVRTTISIRNVSPSDVVLTVLDACPVVLRFVAFGRAGEIVYTQENRPCVRRGRMIRLQPDEAVSLNGVASAEELRAQAFGTGQYRVISIVTAGADQLAVDCGVISLS